MSHPTIPELERWLAKELDPSASLTAQQHIQGCPICRDKLSQMESAQQKFLLDHPPDSFAQKVEARCIDLQHTQRRRIFAFSAAGALAASVSLLLVFTGQPAQKEGLDLWKGAKAAVTIYLRRGDRVEIVSGQRFQAGDRLRYEIGLPPGSKAYAALIAIENQQVYAVLPEKPSAGPFNFSGTFLLPGSVSVEADTKNCELTLFVRPDHFSIPDLIAELQRLLASGSLQTNPPAGLVHQLHLEVGAP